jgi:hypothetical protein
MLKVGLPYDYGSSAFVCLVPLADINVVGHQAGLLSDAVHAFETALTH